MGNATSMTMGGVPTMQDSPINKAILAQDLERLKFASDLRKNPKQYGAYVDQKVDALTGEVFNRKRAAFQKAQIDLGRYMDMDHNTNFYKMRNGDVQRLAMAMDANNQAVKDKLETDLELSKRQFEINEWQNQNKLETLFFLQVFFIGALAMAIIIFLQKTAAITNSMASLLTLLLLGIVVVIGVYRYYYTRRTRDNRLWHRRYFGTAKAPKGCKTCDPNGNITVDLNCLGMPEGVGACAEEKAFQFARWQREIQNEMLSYQEAGTSPAAVIGAREGPSCSSAEEQQRMLAEAGVANTGEALADYISGTYLR